jgi:hypothetical protein
MTVMDALLDRSIEFVTTRHEQRHSGNIAKPEVDRKLLQSSGGDASP